MLVNGWMVGGCFQMLVNDCLVVDGLMLMLNGCFPGYVVVECFHLRCLQMCVCDAYVLHIYIRMCISVRMCQTSMFVCVWNVS